MNARPWKRVLQPLFLLLVLIGLAAPSASAATIPQQVAQRVAAATVMVQIEYGPPDEHRISWGTGFVVGDGLIMTNAHVVSDGVPQRVYVYNQHIGRTEARIIATRHDPNGLNGPSSTYYDVALLAYSPPATVRLPVLSFSLNPSMHEGVYAFGFPGPERGLQNMPGYGSAPLPVVPLSVTAGVVNEILQTTPSILMHDALCRLGSSGGPIVNGRGEVIGMQTWSADPDINNRVDSFAIGSGGLTAFMQSTGYRPYVAS